ncbi:MAG: serine/threonine protein kinase [Kiritimatiellae bacterium]|nr:serine/threonine protein kinase [Kiritimatiellia bacterium]
METMDNGMDDALTIGGLETLRDGDTLWLAGRYKVVRRLGEGGMGSVWLAEDTKLDGKQFAIKMLPAVFAGKKGAYRQVKQEALMAMKLSHPNIATVRAFEEDEGGAPFLVMDYIEGRGLDEILAEKGPLGEAETRRLLGPVAAALDYAHSQGVVHRDVKPGNVMVRKDGTPFVLDFGIAREIQETMTRVTGKFSSGTLLYMSPEQLRGRAPKPAQDVYSFAAMAYECLTGAPPFSRGQIEYQIVNEAPEPLPADAAAEPLRQGIMAGLAKEPEARPGTCMEVLGNGGASRPGEPVAGTPAGATAGMSSNGGARRSGRGGKRKRAWRRSGRRGNELKRTRGKRGGRRRPRSWRPNGRRSPAAARRGGHGSWPSCCWWAAWRPTAGGNRNRKRRRRRSGVSSRKPRRNEKPKRKPKRSGRRRPKRNGGRRRKPNERQRKPGKSWNGNGRRPKCNGWHGRRPSGRRRRKPKPRRSRSGR